MKERPILFSASMVRAILDGRKTQTRRIVKPQPDIVADGGLVVGVSTPEDQKYGRLGKALPCPYGKPGERLWVRESWAWYGCEYIPSDVVYRADTESLPGEYGRWRPSIHMPRWASRITLEITEVRVERLHDISDDDIKAEGIFDDPAVVSGEREGSILTLAGKRIAFEDLWESINGPDSWDENPWVWVVGFRRVT